MDLNIKDRIALVTGARRSIGEDVCIQLAKEDVRLICVSKSKDNLNKL